MLAACGLASVLVYRRPRVAVLSTGDGLVQPGEPLPPAAIYDTNAAIVAAAVEENGGTAVTFGAIRDDEPALEATLRKALTDCDMIVLSGGTSKSAGDLSYRVLGSARASRHPGTWRGFEAGQAPLPCCRRRETSCHSPRVSNFSAIYLPRFCCAGATRDVRSSSTK